MRSDGCWPNAHQWFVRLSGGSIAQSGIFSCSISGWTLGSNLSIPFILWRLAPKDDWRTSSSHFGPDNASAQKMIYSFDLLTIKIRWPKERQIVRYILTEALLPWQTQHADNNCSRMSYNVVIIVIGYVQHTTLHCNNNWSNHSHHHSSSADWASRAGSLGCTLGAPDLSAHLL